MSKQINRYIKRFSVFSIVILIVGIVSYATFLKDFYLLVLPYIWIAFVLLSASMHYFLVEKGGKDFTNFRTYFMVGTIIKMFASLVFIAIYIFLNREKLFEMIVPFLVLYFSFLIFEISALLNHFKPK